MEKKYKVADLFAGIGGMSKGLKDAGAEIIWANDNDTNACEIYRYNMPEVNLIKQDIYEVDVELVPSFDILIAGFHFPLFSIVGNRTKRTDNKKKELFFQIVRFLEAKKPKVFLLECTIMLLRNYNGGKFKEIIGCLSDIGYNIKYEGLNAMEHGNIPQNCEKLYIVGFRDYNNYNRFSFPQCVKLERSIYHIINLNEEQENKYYYTAKSKNYSILEKNIRNQKSFYQLKANYNREDILEKTTEEGKHSIKVLQHEVCPALTATMMRVQHVPIIRDNYGIRRLTPKECFCLQGLDDYKLPNNLSDTLLYRLIGNSSVASVIAQVAENIISVLEMENTTNKNISKKHKNVNTIDILKDEEKTRNYSQITLFEKEIYDGSKENNKSIETPLQENKLTNKIVSNRLQSIKPGNIDADRFCDYIFEIICIIFEDVLHRGKKEFKINDGRKRVDIIFDNSADKGFFYELRNMYSIKCPKIIIECKNYSSTPTNPEIDQLLARFNKHIGKFGILVCRTIVDKERLLKRCKDALHGDQGYVIVFCDNDIEELIKLYNTGDIQSIDNYMRDRFDELIL